MNLWRSGELILLAAPICGLAINVVVQLGLYRYARFTLMNSILWAIFVGLIPLSGLTLWSFEVASPLSMIDALALSVTMIITYFSGCAVIFAVINLGETSLRIRMMQMLNESPNGMELAQIIKIYDDTALFDTRVSRLVEQRQVIRVAEVLIIRRSTFFYIAALIGLFKLLLYGSLRNVRSP